MSSSVLHSPTRLSPQSFRATLSEDWCPAWVLLPPLQMWCSCRTFGHPRQVFHPLPLLTRRYILEPPFNNVSFYVLEYRVIFRSYSSEQLVNSASIWEQSSVMINFIRRSQTVLTSRIFIFVSESCGLVELSYGTGRSGGNPLLMF